MLAALGIVPILIAGGAIGFLLVRAGGAITLQHLTITDGLVVQLCAEAPVVPYLLWVMTRVWGRSLRELGFRVPAPREIGIGVLGAIAMVVLVQGLSALIQSALHVEHVQTPVQLLKAIHLPATLIFFTAYAVLVAPFAEELTFRVFTYNTARSYLPFLGAAALSGVLFGLAHADVYAFFPLVLGGMLLCKVYDYTKNAWISMISHGLFNGTTIVALLAIQKAGIH